MRVNCLGCSDTLDTDDLFCTDCWALAGTNAMVVWTALGDADDLNLMEEFRVRVVRRVREARQGGS